MSKKEDKVYTKEEAARAVLAKAHEMLKNSILTKSNTAHEIEAGEEPNNDDAETPEYLANADIENSDTKKNKKKAGEGSISDENEEHVEAEDMDEESESDEESDFGSAESSDEDEVEEEVEEETEEEDYDEDDDKDDENDKFSKYAKSESASKKKKKKKKDSSRVEEMTDEEDKKLDQSGEYVHGALGKSVKDMKTGEELSSKEQKARAKIQTESGDQGLGSKQHAKIEAYRRRSRSATEAATNRRNKKMAKSEVATKDGIEKVYEFLAKSCEKKADIEEKQSSKEEKKNKLKKMAGQMKPQEPTAPVEQMKPQSGGTGMKGY